MKWQIWIEPNKIIEEEYPNGWTHDEVMEAASARWANKVTTVNPAPTGRSDDNDSRYGNTNTSSSSGGSMQLPSLKTLLVGGLVLYGLSLFGGNKVEETQPTESNTGRMEYVQPANTNSTPSLTQRWEERSNQIDAHRNEFFNTSYQEEAIDDLGQDWDK